MCILPTAPAPPVPFAATPAAVIVSVPLDLVNVSQLNDVCRQYLSDTDWYVARKSEVNKDIPDHIKTLRATMRKLIT